jgi:hypothetical protein
MRLAREPGEALPMRMILHPGIDDDVGVAQREGFRPGLLAGSGHRQRLRRTPYGAACGASCGAACLPCCGSWAGPHRLGLRHAVRTWGDGRLARCGLPWPCACCACACRQGFPLPCGTPSPPAACAGGPAHRHDDPRPFPHPPIDRCNLPAGDAPHAVQAAWEAHSEKMCPAEKICSSGVLPSA